MAKRQQTMQRQLEDLAPTAAYEVVVGLSYPTDPAIVARLARGDRIPAPDRGLKRAEPGEIVDDIPSVSVPWLLEQGLIRPATRAPIRTPSAQAPEPTDEEE